MQGNMISLFTYISLVFPHNNVALSFNMVSAFLMCSEIKVKDHQWNPFV